VWRLLVCPKVEATRAALHGNLKSKETLRVDFIEPAARALCLTFGISSILAMTMSRSLVLATSQLGWAMYLPNVMLEMCEKRLSISRWRLEAVVIVLASVAIGIGTDSTLVGLMTIAAYLLLVLENLLRERRLFNAVYGVQERVGLRGKSMSADRFPGPALHPKLSVNLEGPFISRVPSYRLGVLQVDSPVRLALLVGNHCRVPGQTSIKVAIEAPPGWEILGAPTVEFGPLRPGQVYRAEWALLPRAVSGGATLKFSVKSSRFERHIEVVSDGCLHISSIDVAHATVTRYPGGRQSAFSLRGDFDLYDQASFQSIAGLEDAFGLTSRYAIAQTMYVSTRLAIDQKAATEWAAHYDVQRGAAAIPTFISWLRERVELRHTASYPVSSERAFVVELGNHGHLHYDTDASAAPGNNWKAGAKPGEGHYEWQGTDGTSFGDQRDNILHATQWCERALGFRPRSWAKPGRGNDQFSPAAVEAAGCDVATGSDIGPQDNVLRQPPPHHPAGTKIVELTARYPSDPQHVQHLAMLEFWLHRGHRLGRPTVVLVHQHMRQFDGVACARLTECLLDRVVNNFNGDQYIDTVYGVGRYWLDVLSPITGMVSVEVGRNGIEVSNRSTHPICALPVDIKLRDGGRLTRLVNLMPSETAIVLV
jgi:hypothetical protein